MLEAQSMGSSGSIALCHVLTCLDVVIRPERSSLCLEESVCSAGNLLRDGVGIYKTPLFLALTASVIVRQHIPSWFLGIS